MPDLDTKQLDEIARIVQHDIVPVLAIIIGGLIALRVARWFVHGVVKTLLDREATEGTAQELSAVELKKRMETLDGLGSHALQFFIVIIVILMVLGQIGLDIGPAVAGLGVVGIAVGFGAQSLVRDYLNGSLIMIENQFSKGDVIRIAGVAGTVEDFTLRRTTLRDLDGIVHTVPNGEIKVASNMTRVWARINEDVMVAYGTDLEMVSSVVEEVGRQMADDPVWKRRVLEAPRVDRISALGESGVSLKILGTVRAQDQWAAAGDLRRRLLLAFAEHSIEIPFPHVVTVRRTEPTEAADAGHGAPSEGPPEDG